MAEAADRVSWVDAAPDAPGYYWVRQPGAPARVVRLIYSVSGLRVAVAGGWDHALDALRGAAWSGPLEKPTDWTSGVPEVAGHYWVKSHALIAAVACVQSTDPLDVLVAGHRADDVRIEHCVWSAPLAAPL